MKYVKHVYLQMIRKQTDADADYPIGGRARVFDTQPGMVLGSIPEDCSHYL